MGNRRQRLGIALLGAVLLNALAASDCDAGPLLDWLYGRQYAYAYRQPYAVPQATNYYRGAPAATTYYRGAPAATYYRPPTTAYSVPAPAFGPTTSFYRAPNAIYRAPTATYFRAPASSYPRRAAALNPSPGVATYYRDAPQANAPTYCGGLTTCRPYTQRLNYAPRTSYRSAWQRIPVTAYRPVTQIDPTTGARVNVMQPCTTYRWQVRRRPNLLWRPWFSWFRPTSQYAYAPNPAEYCPPQAATPTPADAEYYDRSRRSREEEWTPVEPRDGADRRPSLEGDPTPQGEARVLERERTAPVDRTVQRRYTPPRRSLSPKPEPEPENADRKPPRKSVLADPDYDSPAPAAPRLLKSSDRTARRTIQAYQAVWPQPARPVVRRARHVIGVGPKSIDQLDDTGWRSVRGRRP